MDLGSIPGLGRSPGGGHGNPLQYSYLENPMDRAAWWATVHGVTKSQSQVSTAQHSVYILLSVSWFVPSLHMWPLVTIVCFLYLWVCFCFANKFVCTFFFLDSTYKLYHMIFIFVWFASHSWQIWVHHVAANGIIPFFVMAEWYSIVCVCVCVYNIYTYVNIS